MGLLQPPVHVEIEELPMFMRLSAAVLPRRALHSVCKPMHSAALRRPSDSRATRSGTREPLGLERGRSLGLERVRHHHWMSIGTNVIPFEKGATPVLARAAHTCQGAMNTNVPGPRRCMSCRVRRPRHVGGLEPRLGDAGFRRGHGRPALGHPSAKRRRRHGVRTRACCPQGPRPARRVHHGYWRRRTFVRLALRPTNRLVIAQAVVALDLYGMPQQTVAPVARA